MTAPAHDDARLIDRFLDGTLAADVEPQLRQRLTEPAFADALARAGAGGVEIAQVREFHAVGGRDIAARALDHQFGPAIGADRVLRMRFIHRQALRFAIGGAGR